MTLPIFIPKSHLFFNVLLLTLFLNLKSSFLVINFVKATILILKNNVIENNVALISTKYSHFCHYIFILFYFQQYEAI